LGGGGGGHMLPLAVPQFMPTVQGTPSKANQITFLKAWIWTLVNSGITCGVTCNQPWNAQLANSSVHSSQSSSVLSHTFVLITQK